MGPSEPSAEEQGAGRGHSSAVWDPEVYLRYADERARPFNELVARVGAESPRTVVDLGCGEGALTASLAVRWPEARITGIDSSPEMLAAAAAHTIPGRVEFAASDARVWRPEGQIDVLMSNALLPTGRKVEPADHGLGRSRGGLSSGVHQGGVRRAR